LYRVSTVIAKHYGSLTSLPPFGAQGRLDSSLIIHIMSTMLSERLGPVERLKSGLNGTL